MDSNNTGKFAFRRSSRVIFLLALAAAASIALASCGDDSGSDNSSLPGPLQQATEDWNTNWAKATIAFDELLLGGPPRDGIPSIDDPDFVSTGEASEWVADNEPVIVLELEGEARAYPLQVLTWHEIVNDKIGDTPVVVTFCPLCNAGLVFDRRLDGETYEFGTSGLLRNSDLVMYDRTSESLWQQLTGEAIVGDLAGETLTFVPSSIVSYADFKDSHPDGMVLSKDTGYDRAYGENPYAGYDDIDSNPFLFTGDADGRLPAMERVVAVNLDGVDVAYPFSTISEAGVVNDRIGETDVVVFHAGGTSSALDSSVISEGADVGASGVFEATLDGEKLTFRSEDGSFVDEQTGSTWNILGEAVAGPRQGDKLVPVVHALNLTATGVLSPVR
jgi:hypothetical protein